MSTTSKKIVLTALTDSQYRYFLAMITFSLMVASAPAAAGFHIIGELGGTASTVSYGVSFFVLGELLTKPHGLVWGDRIGKLKLLKICLATYVVLNCFILIVTTHWQYLLFRFLSGIAIGPIFLIGTFAAGAIGPKRPRVRISFLFIMINLLLIVPVFAAAGGALLAYDLSWRVIYALINLYALILLLILPIVFKGQEFETNTNPIDWVGIYSMAVGLFCLGFCLVTWLVIDGLRSLLFNIFLFVGAIHTLFFILWTIWHPYPVLKLKLLKKSFFIFGVFYSVGIYSFLFAVIVLLSIWLHLFVNFSNRWVAFSLLGLIIAPILLTITFRFYKNPRSVLFVSLGLLMLSLTSFYISKYNVDINFGRILIAKIIAGVSLVLALPYIINQLLRSCDAKAEIPLAFGLWAMVRVGSSFVGVSFFNTIWERRRVFFHSRLGGELTPFSESTQTVLDKLNFFHFDRLMKLEALNGALEKQAAVLALNDCYFVIGWVVFITWLFSIFHTIAVFRKPKETHQVQL